MNKEIHLYFSQIYFANFLNKCGKQYLPPANEVWGKVLFLHLSVVLFTGGLPLGDLPPGALPPGDVCIRGDWADPPPELEKRAVCILLQSFLFYITLR